MVRFSYNCLPCLCFNVDARSPTARYLNTNNFLRNIRNFKMDITRTDPAAYVCAIHWQVAQGTSLENIEFYMSQDAGTTQQVCPASNLVFFNISGLTLL
jgi:hypothetical protein